MMTRISFAAIAAAAAISAPTLSAYDWSWPEEIVYSCDIQSSSSDCDFEAIDFFFPLGH
jgi:hypothetical protein